MSTIPILLDRRPGYLGTEHARGSLLLVPLGLHTLIDDLTERCAAVTAYPPLVMPLFEPDEVYRRAIRDACPRIDGVISRELVADPLERFDPADSLLFISPDRYPANGLSLELLAGFHEYDVRVVRHLLAFETTSLRTKELVHAGADGRVRRIQRYFEPVTWPFAAAVLASRVPVTCLLARPQAPLSSLADLRAQLTDHGVPSHDMPVSGHLFDLMDEAGALALAEHCVVTALDRPEEHGPGHTVVSGSPPRVHATARFLGPVSIAPDAVIGPRALVVGPTLVGSGAQVGADAVVAQCLVMPGACVADAATVRHRVVVARTGEETAEHTRVRRHARRATTPGPIVARSRATYAKIKAVVEPPLAVMLLILLAPLMAVISLVIALSSRGPIVYRALREGKDGRPFHCLKFRSMRANADVQQRRLAAQQQMDGPQFKMERDPRVTRVGWWLRRLNLDELPQLLNVARGEMSFVGPRPSPFRENQICIPWRHGRLSVRPGITGLWQVCRRDRSAGDFHQWIYYDLLYVRHQSLLVDVKVLLATVTTLGGNRPATLESIIPATAADAALRIPMSVPAAVGEERRTRSVVSV